MRIKNIKHNTSNLRLKAEEMHKSLSINPKDNLTITETKEFIHELEVHQIELEIMNSELVMANEQIWLKEQRIEEANKKFIELYDFAPSGYFSLTKEGDIVEINLSGANMLGKPSHRLLRSQFALYISDKTRPIFNTFFKTLIEGKGTQTCHVTLFANENLPIAVAITGTLSENSATCLINVIDITALNKAEQELEKSNLLFSSIFYNSPDALIIIRLNDNFVINCNEKYLKLFGFSSMDEVVGKNTDQLNVKPIQGEFSKIASLIKNNKSVKDFEIQLRNNQGKLIWVSTSIETLFLDNSLCTITSSINITTQKLAQDALLESKIRYHSLVSNLNVGVLVQGPNAEMILSNPRALELLGLTEEQLIGKSSFDPYWNVIHEDGSPFPGHTHPVPMSIATGQPVINVVMGVFRPLTNDRVWLLVNADPQLKEDGSIREVICTFKEITEIVNKTEELKNKKIKIENFLKSNEKIGKMGNWEFKLSEKKLYPSTGAAEIYGTDKKIITFDELKRFRQPEYKSYLDDALSDLISKNKPYDVEYKIKRENDGRIVDVNATAIFDVTSNTIFGTIRDITEQKNNEKLLNENEIEYKILFEDKSTIKLIINPNGGHIMHANAEASQFYGWPLKELIKKTVFDLNIDKTNTTKKNIQLTAQGINFHREVKHKLADGSIKDIEIFSNDIEMSSKKYLLTSIIDITQRKIAEENALKLSRINKLTSKINELILYATDESTLLDEACQLTVKLGNFRMAWIGMLDENTGAVIPVIHAGGNDGYLDEIKIISKNNTLNENGPTRTSIKNKNYSVCNDIENDPMMALWKTTALAHGFHSIISLPLIKNKEVVGVYVLYSSTVNYFDNEEITLLKEVSKNLSFAIENIEKEALRKQYLVKIAKDEESIRILSTAIDQSPIMSEITDLEGNIIYVNRKFTEVTGYTPEEVIGKNPRILKSDHTPQLEYKTLWDTIKNGKSWHGTFLNKKKNGETYWESAVISPVKTITGEITHFLGIKEDITNLILAEEEKSNLIKDLIGQNKNLEQFAYIVSHNLRSPVSNIIGLKGLLKLKNLSNTEKELYETQILKSVEKLDDVIRDLNAILQVKNQLNAKVETIHFSEIINSINLGLKSLIESENITFKLNFKDAEKTDTIKSYLHSIFFNLISNSIKYRSQSPPIIEITTRIEGDKLIILYKDNGIGIDLVVHGQNLFGLYQRFHKGHAEGKGIGLYMVKTQIESLGGKISASSHPDKGIEFKIEFKNNKIVTN